ncbi:MAG: ATP-binding protein [Planctomycetes bacterium]|nr:ATP-binding protein [Planctomycetota bacterium]
MPDPARPNNPTAGAIHERIQITNETKNLIVVREFMTKMVGLSRLRKEDENKVILAVDEAISNIIEHAFEETRTGEIEIEVDADDARFAVTIRDSGKEFDPKKLDPGVNILDHVKQGKRHGLGIFIMRQIMDEVNYIFKEGVQNELRLVKYING